jgi:hypothetical protein
MSQQILSEEGVRDQSANVRRARLFQARLTAMAILGGAAATMTGLPARIQDNSPPLP